MRYLNFILFSLLLLPETGSPQKFNRENYLDYLPPRRKVITQTRASAYFHLYGDSADSTYRDQKPIDGIDDDRFKRLCHLACQFSPVLFRNNFSAPRDFEEMLKFAKNPYLYVHTWRTEGDSSQNVRKDSVDLNLLLGSDPDYFPAEDAKLKGLLKEFHPDSSKTQKISPDSVSRKVLYFDFAGNDEKSWKKENRNLYKGNLSELSEKNSRIYAHPLIYQKSGTSKTDNFEFVIQYWFFYPFNDGGNNHEGDWEHINVSITTKARKKQLLTEQDVWAILDNENEEILDQLIIRKVDYYFHHFVMTLDYQAVDFLQSREQVWRDLAKLKESKILRTWIHQQVYHRIHFVPDTINTHPVAYIGADNQGLDQILAGPGGKNRNSHGTYPFPGVWKNVGPLGATEKILGGKKLQFNLPEVPRGRGMGKVTPRIEQYESGTNPIVKTYFPKQITIVPDWERLQNLVLTNSKVRRQWFWLMLPIRWGFPVAKSPGGGLFKHTDLGNAAPVGPAYNTAWNRIGSSAGYTLYDPHVIPSQFQISVQDHFRNSLGFFNLTYPLWKNLPVANLIWFIGPSRLENNPKFVTRNELPFRFGSLAYRPFYMGGDNNFARLLPHSDNSEIAAFIEATGDSIVSGSYKHEDRLGLYGWMFNLHIGRHVSVENTYSGYSSDISYDLGSGGQISGKVKGKLRFREYVSSMRVSLMHKNVQPFLRAGYGWSWYKADEVELDGQKLTVSDTEWFHNPTFPFLPNSFHLGAGIELFPQRNYGLTRLPFLGQFTSIGTPEIGLRIEYTLHMHKIGSDVPLIRKADNITRHELGLALVVGL